MALLMLILLLLVLSLLSLHSHHLPVVSFDSTQVLKHHPKFPIFNGATMIKVKYVHEILQIMEIDSVLPIHG